MYPGAQSRKKNPNKHQQVNQYQPSSVAFPQPPPLSNQPPMPPGYQNYNNHPQNVYFPTPHFASSQNNQQKQSSQNLPFPRNELPSDLGPNNYQYQPRNYNVGQGFGYQNASSNLQPSPNYNTGHNNGQPISQNIPNNQPHPGSVNNVQVSNCQGRKKAVYIGINYFGQNGQLRGCINDVNNIRSFLAQHYGFTQNVWVLTDDQTHQPGNMPTRKNLIAAMHWLVKDAQPNDSLFFHYSGHGGQTEDLDGDEEDGFDETILPVDYKTAGEIVDDEMNAIMVHPLPPGCRLTAIFDSCHSGTALDLPYVYNSHGKLISYNPKKAVMTSAVDIGKKYLMGDKMGALMSLKKGFDILTKGNKAEKITQETRGSMADVIMFSGCADSQTSADTQVANESTGAMSYAFIQTLKNNPYGYSYIQLLNDVRNLLKQKYSQVPQLSSGRPMDMNYAFIL